MVESLEVLSENIFQVPNFINYKQKKLQAVNIHTQMLVKTSHKDI